MSLRLMFPVWFFSPPSALVVCPLVLCPLSSLCQSVCALLSSSFRGGTVNRNTCTATIATTLTTTLLTA
uniref:Putative secreted protein n=1 Tax=Anopheles triannulatus TaxID=58253 RepID=A0A2M4B2K6_9DIPT